MENTPLTVRIPVKGTVLLRIDGQEALVELGRITYTANVDIQLTAPDTKWETLG